MLALLLSAAALTLFVIFLRDPLGHDDRRIFTYAERFLNGLRGKGYAPTHFRLGFILEHALAQYLFGYSTMAYYAVALFNSTMVVCSVFFLSRLFFPRTVASICAIALATNPYFLTQACWPQVDWPAAWRFFFGLSLTILAVRRSDIPAIRRYLLAVGAGFFLWWSFYTKISVAPLLLCVPSVIFFVRFDRRSWVCVLVMAVVSASFLGVGFWLNDLVFGDPFVRLKKVEEARTFEYSERVFLSKGTIPRDLTWTDLALRYPRLYWLLPPGRLFIALCVLAGLAALITRRRALLFFLLLALVSWGFISLMVTNTDPLVPVIRTKDRYFSAPFGLLTIFIVGSAWVLYETIRQWIGRRWLRRAFSALSVLGAAALVTYNVDYHRRHAIGYKSDKAYAWSYQGGLRTMRDLIRVGVDGVDVRRALTDTRNLALLRMFTPASNWDRVKGFDNGSTWLMSDLDDFKRGDLVYLHFGRLGSNQKKYYKNRIPEFIYGPPPQWKRVWSAYKQAIYFVTETIQRRPVGNENDPPVSLLQAYAHDRNAQTQITRTSGVDRVGFDIQNGTDVRIVGGTKRYIRRPDLDGTASVLKISRALTLDIDLSAHLKGDLQVDNAYIVLFTRGAKRPKLHECNLDTLRDGGVRITKTMRVDPEQGHEAFNLLLKIRGSGSITVTDFVISELGYEARSAVRRGKGARAPPGAADLSRQLEDLVRSPEMAGLPYWRSKPPMPATFAYPRKPTLTRTERSNVERLKNGEFSPHKLFDWHPLGVPPPWDTNRSRDKVFEFYKHALVWTVPLVDAWICEQDRGSRILLRRVIEDWVRANSTPPGASRYVWRDHATSYRLRLMCWMWESLRRDESVDFEFGRLLLASIYQHAMYAADRNNYNPKSNHALHLDGSLLATAVTLPEFREANRWRALVDKRLARYCARNFSPEGFHLEQSPFYHYYVIVRLGEIVTFLRDNRQPVPAELQQTIDRALSIWPYFLRSDRSLSNVGDSHTPPGWRVKLRRIAGGELPAPAESTIPNPRSDASGFLLSFNAGYAIFTSYTVGKTDSATDTHAVFRCNSWYHTAHCHNDALSFELFGIGREWLIDSGQSNVATAVDKAFLRSARAHNVCLVDDENFSFHPITLVDSGRTSVSDFVTVRHELPQAHHTRRFEFQPPRTILLTDTLKAVDGKPHIYTQLFHVAAGLRVQIVSPREVQLIAESGDRCVIRQDGDRGEWSVTEGQREPFIQGWYSREFREFRANPTLQYRLSPARSQAKLVTQISLVGRSEGANP